jgi:VanZ family protein
MKIKKYWKPILIGLLILYASIAPADNITKVNLFNIKHLDKLIHFFMYYIFTLTLFAALNNHSLLTKNRLILITLSTTIIYGLLMESLQYLITSDRSPEFFDALANTLGSVMAIISFPFWKKFRLYKYL